MLKILVTSVKVESIDVAWTKKKKMKNRFDRGKIRNHLNFEITCFNITRKNALKLEFNESFSFIRWLHKKMSGEEINMIYEKQKGEEQRNEKYR